MAGPHGDDVAHDAASEEHEVADDVENLVPHKFVVETQRMLAEHGVAADDDGALQRAAFDQALLHQRGDVLIKNKSAGRGDFLFVILRGNLGGEKLGRASFRPHVGAGNAEFFVGHDGQQ